MNAKLLGAASCLFVAGCGTMNTEPAPVAPLAITGPSGFSATVGPCILGAKGGAESGILGQLALGALTKGLDLFTASLKAAGDPNAGKAQVDATVPLTMSKGTTPSCLFLARGNFASSTFKASDNDSWGGAEGIVAGLPTATPTSSTSPNRPSDDFDSQPVGATPPTLVDQKWPAHIALKGIAFRDQPAFFAEFKITRAPDGKSVRFDPHFVAFSQPLASFLFRSDTQRSIALDLTLYAPGDDPGGAKAYSTHVDLGRFAPGARRDFRLQMKDELNADKPATWFASSWMPLPDMTEVKKGYNLRIRMTEIQNPNAAARFFGEVLEGAKTEFANELKLATDSDARHAAKLAEIKAQDTLLASYSASLVTACKATIAVKDLAAGSTPAQILDATKAASDAQRSANSSALAADLASPWPTVIGVTQTKPSASEISLTPCG